MTEERWLVVANIEVIIKTPDGGRVVIQYTGDHSSTEATEAIHRAVEKAAGKAMSVEGLLLKEEAKHE